MGPTLFLVENNRKNMEYTLADIRRAKPEWKLAWANCCERAIETFSVVRPHAAVVDSMLPDGDGLDLLKDLQKLSPGLPAIMLSDFVSDDLFFKARDSGAYTLLKKPFLLESLIIGVEMAIAASIGGLRPQLKALPKSSVAAEKSGMLCLLPASRAIALYRSFDFFAMFPQKARQSAPKTSSEHREWLPIRHRARNESGLEEGLHLKTNI